MKLYANILRMPHHIKFVKDIGLVGFAQILTNLRGIILIPILTKFLGAEQYGIWAQFSITLNFIVPLAILSLPNALIRFLPGTKSEKEIQEQVWSTNLFVLGITLCLAILLIIFARQLGGILQIPHQLIFFLSILVILQSLGFLLSSVLQALQEAKKLSFYIVGVPLAEIIFISLAVLLGFELYGAILSLVIARSITFFILLVAILQKIGFKRPNFSLLKEYLRFSVPMVATNLAYRVVQVGDHYLIGIMLGVLFVGYYAPAYSFAFMLNTITLPIGLILPALLARFFSENNTREIQRYLQETFKYTFFILIPAVFGLSILSKPILTIFTTPDIANHSSLVLPVTAASFLFFAAYGIFIQILYLFKKTTATGVMWIGAAALNVLLNLFFIPFWGIAGAAFATLLSYMALCLVAWIYSSRYLSFSLPWIPLCKSIAASVGMSFVLLILNPKSLLAMFFAIIAGVLLYGAFLYILKAVGRKETEFLRQLWKTS